MKKLITLMLAMMMVATVLAGCAAPAEEPAEAEKTEATEEVAEETAEETVEPGVVNLYTDRHYDTDAELYAKFTEMTGIEVNVIKGKGDELIERMTREDADTEADLLVTADAGRLFRAKDAGLLQTVESDIVNENVPANLRDKDSNWIGLTMRGRVIVYAKDRVTPDMLSTYEDLTDPKWEGKILVRSSSNIYNQSLLASFIEVNGEEATKEWAAGLVKNMAREPQGNDRAQATAVVAGEGDLAIMNTYYIGKMINSENPEEVNVANNVGIFFPNQETTGTHINVSGAGLAKHSKNKENAVKLIEFLTSEQAQGLYSSANYEYPVNPNVEPSDLLKSWGEFKTQDINLTVLGDNNLRAVEIFNEVNWQ